MIKYYYQNKDNIKKCLKIIKFDRYIVPFLVMIIAMFFKEIKRKNYSLVYCGLAVALMDLALEIWNALIYYNSKGYSGLWLLNKG